MSKENNQKFSIITVTLNCAKTIERTIESVICQIDSIFEYIIIDGNSIDGTQEIIKKYIGEIDYYLSEPDHGIYDAMNKGLKVASGNLVIFLNGDDYFINDTVLKRISSYYVNDHTIIIGRLKYGDKISLNMANRSIKSKYYDIFYPHQATFVPKALYDRLGGFDDSYRISGDFEWICRAMYHKYEVNWIDEIVSCFSLGGASSSLQCTIEVYNVSKKYMSLTHDKLIDDMKNKIVDKAKSVVFGNMILDETYINDIGDVLKEMDIDTNDSIQLWGAGYWAEPIVAILSKNGVKVDCIFDSNSDKRGKRTDCIPVKPYDKNFVKRIIISTDIYDDEISKQLEGDGFRKDIDFFGFHSFRDKMLDKYDVRSEMYKDFVEQTGLSLF